jgi:hypothetical protein
MKGHGEKQSRTEERAILVLLAEPTLERAAKKCGIGVTTLWRWLQEPEFQRHYREARRTVFEETLLSLQSIAGEAVETLQRNLGVQESVGRGEGGARDLGSGSQSCRTL